MKTKLKIIVTVEENEGEGYPIDTYESLVHEAITDNTVSTVKEIITTRTPA